MTVDAVVVVVVVVVAVVDVGAVDVDAEVSVGTADVETSTVVGTVAAWIVSDSGAAEDPGAVAAVIVAVLRSVDDRAAGAAFSEPQAAASKRMPSSNTATGDFDRHINKNRDRSGPTLSFGSGGGTRTIGEW